MADFLQEISTIVETGTTEAGSTHATWPMYRGHLPDSTVVGDRAVALLHAPGLPDVGGAVSDGRADIERPGLQVVVRGLSLSQYIPAAGYKLTYEVFISYKTETVGGSAADFEYAFRLQANGSTVEGPYSFRQSMASNTEFGGGTVCMRYVTDSLTPGTTYAMTTDVWTKGDGSGDANTIIFNPTVGSGGDEVATVSRARLIVERL